MTSAPEIQSPAESTNTNTRENTPRKASASPGALVRLKPGFLLRHYELIRQLGTGGMGTVFLARDVRLGRLVAIKFLLRRTGVGAERFLVEARTTAQCRHENIVVIYDVDEMQGHPYMVLEYIEGTTLRDFMHGQARDNVAIVVELMLPVVRALVCAHEMGIVHRDLKPENILLSESGQIKVVDFGIATQALANLDRSSISTDAAPGQDTRLTQDGVLMGTMPYASPEQWLDEPVDGRTDIWAFGIILYEMVTGIHPLEPLSTAKLMDVQDLDMPMPSVREQLGVDHSLADLIDKCLQKRKTERLGSAKELLETIEHIDRAGKTTPPLAEDESPFAGLLAFQESDATRFFGREGDITSVMGRLRHQQFVTIAGASGAGKSSFVRAGLIPALKRVQHDLETFIARPGRFALAVLADVVASCTDDTAEAEARDPLAITKTLRTEPGRLGASLRARCRKRGPNHRITLFIDQFEELYTLGSDVDERLAFYACLEGMADDASSPLRVIVTIRADFLDRVAEDRRFWATLTRGLVFLPPMATEQQREAIKKPLEASRYRFEDDTLVDEMIASLAETKSPLPLLQFTATKLWEARDREKRLLTRQAYLALGGVAGALSTHADGVLAAMSSSEQRLARTILLRLVTPERTRAVVRLDELQTLFEDTTAVERVVHDLADARLLLIETSGEREGTTVELTHESLIERWRKLRQWLDENEKDAAFLEELRNAAAQWEKNGQSEGVLWRDRAATQAGEWFDRRKTDLGTEESLGIGKREVHYLEAVVQLAQRMKRRRRQMVGGLFLAISVIAVVVSGLAIDARAQAKRADEQTKQAQTEARDARNAARIAAARELQAKDPTEVLALVREIESGSNPRGWGSLAMWAIHAGVAEAVLDHKDIVQSVSFSPDGQWLATGAWDKMVRVWNADGSGQPRLFAGHNGRVYAVTFSPEGKRIASASADKTVRIWNADGAGKPVVLEGHNQPVIMVAWSPDGKRVVSASADKTVRIWNADGSGKPLLFEGHTDRVNAAAFSPDGAFIVSGAWDKTLRIWNADGRGEPLVLEGHSARIHSVVFSPDGKRIASGAVDKTVRIWNADGTGQPIVLEGHTDRVDAVVFTPDGKRIASVSTDRTVRIWNADGTGQPIVFNGHTQRVNGVAITPDGKHVASAGSDNAVRIWNIGANATPNVLRGHNEVVEMAVFSPDGRRIVSASVDKTVRVWNADGSGVPVVFRGHSSDATCAAFSPDNKRVVSGSADKTVRIWNADGTGEALVLQGHQGAVQMVRFSSDGQRIVSASNDMTVRVWNADGTGDPVVLKGHKEPAVSAVFSRDGRRILSGSWDKTMRIWNADGSGEPKVIQEFGLVNSAVFSPDEQHVVAGCGDNTLRIWKADGTGEPIVLRGHDAFAGVRGDMIYTPDGKRLVSSSSDGTIRIWNADGKGESIMLQASKTAIRSASFSPNGQQVVVASEDGTVTVLRDLEPLQGSGDGRLWGASSYCMPFELRQRLLGFAEEQSRADLSRCEHDVANARGAARP